MSHMSQLKAMGEKYSTDKIIAALRERDIICRRPLTGCDLHDIIG
jgi:hypothetical protein